MRHRFGWIVVAIIFATSSTSAADVPFAYADPNPQRYNLTARAGEIDPRVKAHPEIEFLLEKDGKPQDVEGAAVDTRVAPLGKLVIWLMGPSPALFDEVTGYGLHAIHVHYARGWFPKFGDAAPVGDTNFLGKIRLEAATGEDVSPAVDIPRPDSVMERAFQLVKHLAAKNPQGRWDCFLSDDGKGLRWDRVILAGSSHGSTTAARLAKHVKVDRIVMFCGPRDQFETWQALPSATPQNRYFAFSHVLDTGWTGGHYCRSWELLGLHAFGPIVNVDRDKPPFGKSRRLITDADVNRDPKRAHGCVVPGKSAVRTAEGQFLHKEVWRYLFTHPIEDVGSSVPPDPNCLKELPRAK